MRAKQIFVCLTTLFALSFSEILFYDIPVNIFDGRPRDFERQVLESSKLLKSFVNRDDVSLAITAGSVALSLSPFYLAKFYKFIPLVRQILADKSDWRDAFTKAIADETMRNVVESEVRWMEATMETIQSKIKLLGDENPRPESRRTIALFMHNELDRMLNFFDIKSSLLRKYPLVGSVPLIQLATLVIVFSPIATALIPLEAVNPQISCKMYDLLVDFLPRTVNARLHQMDSDVSIFRSIVKAMSLPYSAHGYNAAIRVLRGCPDDPYAICLKDKFSQSEYSATDANGIIDYAALVRHRIEDLFPIDVVKTLCIDRQPQIPTGKSYQCAVYRH